MLQPRLKQLDHCLLVELQPLLHLFRVLYSHKIVQIQLKVHSLEMVVNPLWSLPTSQVASSINPAILRNPMFSVPKCLLKEEVFSKAHPIMLLLSYHLVQQVHKL
jgi:hypothetical protein